MEVNKIDEAELLRKIALGDGQAFKILVDRYGALVFYYIRKHARSREIAEEVVQDIFTQVWLVRDTLPGVRNFRTFLYVVSRNYALNVLKKLTRERERQLEYEQQLQQSLPNQLEKEDDWRISLIQQAVASLPSQQQKVWILSRREGLKHTEIAQQMNLSKESVKKYMQWANAFIIKYVEDRIELLIAILMMGKF